MKQILIFLFALATLTVAAQNVPDTIYVVAKTDSTYVIYQGDYFPNLDTVISRPIDAVFDTAGVVTYAFRSIKENEDRQGQADLIKIKADALTRLYADVNSILQQFTGAGYLANARQRYGGEYVGYYVARLGATTSFFRLLANGTSVQVDAQGVTVPGGFDGTWNAITENRFRLVDHFPTGVVPSGRVFTRINGDIFGAPGVAVTFEKVR